MHPRRNVFRLLALLLASALIAAGCGDSGEETTSEPTTTEAPADGATDEQGTDDTGAAEEADDEAGMTALANMSWDEIVAQAREEGEVTWVQWFFQDRFRPFVEAFEEEYGITVTVPDGTYAANQDKFQAESGRETGDIDVLSSNFEDVTRYDYEALHLPLSVLPEFDKLRSSVDGVPTGDRAVAFWGNQSGLAYDSNRLTEADLPQTIEELEAFIAANPRGFGINDPSQGGAGHSFIQSLIRHTTGRDDYFDTEADPAVLESFEPAFDWLRTQDLVWTGSNADSLTRLNDGEFLIVPAWEDMLAGLQVSGELGDNLAVYLPEFGMNGGYNVVTIPANAPHPAAAYVFVHWLTSAETQSALNQTFGSAPQHPEADDAFALIPNSARANSQRWFSSAYGDEIVATVVAEVIGG